MTTQAVNVPPKPSKSSRAFVPLPGDGFAPPLIQDENCELPIASELNGGSQCIRTFLKTPGLPEAPQAANGKDLHGPQNFNALVGEHLTILVHMRLMLKGSGEQPAAEN